MKKRILIVTFILVFITGCTCQYNLDINGNTYTEEIVFTGENSEEVSSFNKEWNITTDKTNDEFGGDIFKEDEEYEEYYDTYDYSLSGNKLTFNYEFSQSEYQDSYAVSNCYSTLNVTNHNSEEGSYVIITTNDKNTCFEEFPSLTRLTVNITVDREVTSNNADRKSGNTYTWNINKDNANNKNINLVYKTATFLPSESSSEESKQEINDSNSFLDKYGLYIFLGIIFLLALFGYLKFKQLKENSNKMDD